MKQTPYLGVKRVLDVLGAIFMLALLSPLFLGIALALLVDSGLPILFKQQRIGRDGRIFNLIKFRTLRRKPTTADSSGTHTALVGQDLDITPVGAWLRNTGLNELPQLINILRGDMSFIGPRPAVLAHEQYYTDWHRQRLAVRPGVTGLAQMCGRNLIPWGWRVALDRYYVENLSFVLDFQIWWKTTGVVLGKKGAEGDESLYFDFTPPGPEVIETLEREGVLKCFLEASPSSIPVPADSAKQEASSKPLKSVAHRRVG
jgi:lipopolysaccharide/colanic/teichoic acid biosynthesis glycosyltransferase